MNSRTHKIFYFVYFFLFYLLSNYQGFCQVFSTGIGENAKKLGFLELKIIEVDPVLNQAKESVPFDKPFFLKITRRTIVKTGPASKKTEVETVTNTSGNTTTVTKKEKEEVIPGSITNNSAKITSATLARLKKPDKKETLTGDFKIEDNPDSEYLYIKIDNVGPEHGYQLEINWDDGGNNPEKFFFTTVSSTLDKRLKNKISPQIGITFVNFKLPNEKLYVLPRLMVGAYYQIRPIDPDIPFKSYHVWALQRFSAYMGLTFNTISDGYIRDDLFGTSNLMVGIGYQPMDALRITAGPLLFTQLDPNRILADRKSLASTLYVGVTLDVKLKDLLGGIITTLGFK